MPITQSAKKALRGSMKKKMVNDRRIKAMKDGIKRVEKLVKTDVKEAVKSLSAAYAAIDKATKKGVLKKNTASRRKAKLAKLIK